MYIQMAVKIQCQNVSHLRRGRRGGKGRGRGPDFSLGRCLLPPPQYVGITGFSS